LEIENAINDDIFTAGKSIADSVKLTFYYICLYYFRINL